MGISYILIQECADKFGFSGCVEVAGDAIVFLLQTHVGFLEVGGAGAVGD